MASLAYAYSRLERADEHFRDISALSTEICAAQAKATKVQVAPGGKLISGELRQLFTVESADTPISLRLGVLIGDCVNSLRSCLDYLVGELADLDSGSRKPKTQFPVELSQKDYRGRRKTFLNGLNEAHVDQLENLQPYKGTGWTAKLARMNNWDKYNKLVLVAHDYMIGGTMKTSQESGANEMALQFDFSIQPSLRVQLEDGLPLLETLAEIRAGVASALDKFAPEFETTT